MAIAHILKGVTLKLTERVDHTVDFPEAWGQGANAKKYLEYLNETRKGDFNFIERDGECLMSSDYIYRGEHVVLVRSK